MGRCEDSSLHPKCPRHGLSPALREAPHGPSPAPRRAGRSQGKARHSPSLGFLVCRRDTTPATADSGNQRAQACSSTAVVGPEAALGPPSSRPAGSGG